MCIFVLIEVKPFMFHFSATDYCKQHAAAPRRSGRQAGRRRRPSGRPLGKSSLRKIEPAPIDNIQPTTVESTEQDRRSSSGYKKKF